MNLQKVFETFPEWVTHNGLRILFIVILTLVAVRLVAVLAKRTVRLVNKRSPDGESLKRSETLGSVVHHMLTVVVIVTAAIMVLGELNIEIGPILAAAGIVGLAVGFGAQDLVQDVINGFFILLEDQIRVGDVVQIAGKAGLVEKVNLKMTILRDLAGNVHFVPNGQIDVVTNMTKEFSRYILDVGVAYREDVDQVIEIIKEIDEGMRNDPDFQDDITLPVEILGLDKFDDSAVIVKAYLTTKPIKQWRVGREFNRRLKKRFDELDIEIPFPHVTLYQGQDKDGSAPPMTVNLQHKSGQS